MHKEALKLLSASVGYHRRFSKQGYDHQPIDGSEDVMNLVDELAMLPGPLVDKVFALYACGVHDYQPVVFDPRHVLAMILYDDLYQPNKIIGRENGILGGDFCCAHHDDKETLLRALCEKIDSFDLSQINCLASDLKQTREQLNNLGVDRETVLSLIDKDLSVYFLTNASQFIFLLIHPFWDRNGRVSEEFSHLICAMYGVEKMFFWIDPCYRYTKKVENRRKLADPLILSQLIPIAEKMGLDLAGEKPRSVDSIYKAWYQSRGKEKEFAILNCIRKRTPIQYLHLRCKAEFLRNEELMQSYYEALRLVLEERIEALDIENFSSVLTDEIVQKLVAHQLIEGEKELPQVGLGPGFGEIPDDSPLYIL